MQYFSVIKCITQFKSLKKNYLKMLPVSHAAVYCCQWLEGPPHPLNPDVNKQSKHICPDLKVPHMQHGPTWSSSSVTTVCTPLWEQSEQTVSLRAQQTASQLLTSSEQQLLGDYSTPVMSTQESMLNFSLSPSHSRKRTLAMANILYAHIRVISHF